MRTDCDVLVLGSGIAGLFFALRTARTHRVCILTKKAAADSATNWAQGGIAAVVAEEDSFDAHTRDTLDAGAGLCREDVVRFVVSQGPAVIEDLLKLGVDFDRGEDGDRFALGQEGGHRTRRVLHTGMPRAGRSKAPFWSEPGVIPTSSSSRTTVPWT